MGYADGQRMMVEYHWLDGQYDGLVLMADLGGRGGLSSRRQAAKRV